MSKTYPQNRVRTQNTHRKVVNVSRHGQQNSQDRNNHPTGAAITTLLTLIAVLTAGCAAQEPANKPHVSQITHSPQATDAGDIDRDGKGDEPGRDGESDATEAPQDEEPEQIEPPAIPDEIYENTLEGAEAAARYYFRAYEYGMRTYDTAPLEFICHEKSSTCEGHIAAARALEERNRVYSGGSIIDGETLEMREYATEVIMKIAIQEEPVVVYDQLGEVGSRPHSELLSEFAVQYRDGQWILRAIVTTRIEEEQP